MNRSFLLASGAAILSLSCSKTEDSIVAAADQVKVTDSDIDRDPIALLPNRLSLKTGI